MKKAYRFKKLAIVCTHPVQYYIPLFKELSKEVDLKVYYTRPVKSKKGYDPGFKKRIEWDLPMLKDYAYVFAGRHVIGALKAYNPDHIFIYGWPFCHHLRIMKQFHRKIWFRGDSILSPTANPMLGWLKSKVLHWVYNHVEKAFYAGSLNKLYFLKYGLAEKQLLFFPHAVDNPRFRAPNPGKSAAIRKRFGIAETDIVVLFAGKLNQNKNPILLVDAFKRVRHQHVHLLIAGDGELAPCIGEIARKSGNIHLLPFQNQTEMPALYQCCDLFCLPSLSDTWGLAINEAMAAGKAVLVSDTAGAAIDLVDDSNGAIFKSGNAVDLEKKLVELTASKAKLHNLGLQGQLRIQNWSIRRQADIILKELNNIIP